MPQTPKPKYPPTPTEWGTLHTSLAKFKAVIFQYEEDKNDSHLLWVHESNSTRITLTSDLVRGHYRVDLTPASTRNITMARNEELPSTGGFIVTLNNKRASITPLCLTPVFAL